MEAFCQEEHLMLGDPTTFTPDYQSKIRISIENVPIELPHTKIRTLSKYATLVTYFITGTRVYSCTTIKEHLQKHIYTFGRHLRIRYDNELTQNEETQQERELQDNNNTSDTEGQLPRNCTYTQQEIQQDTNSQQTSEEEHHTSENEQQTTHALSTKEKQQEQQEETPIPNIHETPDITTENDEQPFITVRKKLKEK